jgi:PAS domain S-box-containing protein
VVGKGVFFVMAVIFQKRRKIQEGEVESYFPLIFNNMKNGIIVLNKDLKVVLWNRTQEEFSGLTIGQVRGKNIIRLFPWLRGQGLEADFRAVLNGERILRERVPYTKPDGSTGYADRDNMPLRSNEGEIIGILSRIAEVTDKVNLEKKLLWAQKFEDLGHMAAGLAHELNNLFTILMAQSDLARLHPDDENKSAAIQAAHKVAMEGSKLTRQLVNFARKPTDQKESADLKEIVMGCVDLLKGVLACEGISIDTELETVPEITINISQFQQLIFNLVRNAKNAMTRGGSLNIGIKLKKIGIRLTVSDNGHGIPPGIIKNLFEPFVTYSPDNKRLGTGLGLSICRDIVHNHGGEIKVRSRLGVGTTFFITLPKV